MSELARLVTGFVFIHACMASIRMAGPLLALKQGYSAVWVGILLALFALAPMFLGLAAGRYADRHGLKRPVGISAVLAIAGAGLAAAWPVFPVLCLAALATGGAAGAASVALQRHVGRAASNPTELKRVFSWLALGPAISGFVGPFSAGLVIDYAGFRAAFLLIALLPLGCWFAVRTTRELPPIIRAEGEAPRRAWDLLREPVFFRLLLINWLMSSAWDVHTFVVPVLGHERGLSASMIGSILGAFAVAATVTRMALPVLAERVSEWAVLTAAMAATAVLFAIYPFMHVALTMGICSVLLGFALGAVQPMVMSMLHQVTPEARHGEALGLRLVAINGASVIMPLMFGAAGAVVGISGVFWIVGTAVGLGTRLALKLKGGRSP